MGNGISLSELVKQGVSARMVNSVDVVARGIAHDSRLVREGDIFVALPGAKETGARYVDDAISKGAVAILSSLPITQNVPVLIADEPIFALGQIAEIIYGNPSSKLTCIGVTGTNGKTTTSTLIEQALESMGEKPAVIGTGSYRFHGEEIQSEFTTPFGDDIARFARKVCDQGGRYLIMEVSSHGLEQKRVDSVPFRVGAFTNLTQDHLDYHGSMENYASAKLRLFKDLRPKFSVVNQDDTFSSQVIKNVTGALLRCSKHEKESEISVSHYVIHEKGIDAEIVTTQGHGMITSSLCGLHNLENLLVALGCLIGIDVPVTDACHALSQSHGAQGRFEKIEDPRGVLILVDYAHTPDALERALQALRPLTKGRLIVVFGCGGDRDRGKRPQMGQVAAQNADLVIITSDNPRSEDPFAIIQNIIEGIQLTNIELIKAQDLTLKSSGYLVEEDRTIAIEKAISAAQQGDTILIAGKGNETYQMIGHEKKPFDDRLEAKRIIHQLSGAAL